MVEAARAGGATALEHYRRGVSVSLKADRSPVTEADRAAEAAILDVLRARCPDHGALGEELGESGPQNRRFIIDPIDGTRNFVRRIPTWAVLIGLEEDDQVIAGVVYQPVTGTLHSAWRGQGAYRDGARIRVSPIDALVAALKVLVEEAGGRLTDLDGRSGIYGSTVLASNGVLHDAALAAMRKEERA